MIFIRFAVIIVLLIALFSNSAVSVKDFFLSFLNNKNEIENLKLENDSLRTELYIAENLSGKEINEGEWEYFSSKVFSSYPFNNQNLISISNGEINGIEEGCAVAAAPGILLGQVIKVNKNIALVRTIFDKDFMAAVKIGLPGQGENQTNALLKGGIPPTLEMIEKSKNIKNGDTVYNADRNYPYGFKLGEVQMIETKDADTAELFKRASLRTNYNPTSLEEVLIIKNFGSLK